MDSKTRTELNTLSKEVFGASSRWQKLITDGYNETVMEEFEEYVPNATDPDGEGTTHKATRPAKDKNGFSMNVKKRFNEETIREYMLERKAKLDEFRALIAAKQAEAQAKKEQARIADLVHKELSGTAVK